MFQRGCDVVIQKSLREKFGLVVSEALWKEKPVVAGNAGGIPMQFPEPYHKDLVNSVENGIKVRRKMLDALHDDNLLARKAVDEQNLRAAIAKDRKLRSTLGDPWRDIDVALANERAMYEPYLYLEQLAGFQGRLAGFARTLVRGTAERDKPNTARYREFTEAVLPRVEQQLGAKLPVYPELEMLRLGGSLERMREWLGPDHPVVRKLMSKESPAGLARRVVTGTQLVPPFMVLYKPFAAFPRGSPTPA